MLAEIPVEVKLLVHLQPLIMAFYSANTVVASEKQYGLDNHERSNDHGP